MANTATYPATVCNMDIIALVSRMDRMYVEMAKCQSSNWASGLFESDLARFNDYLNDFERELEYVISRPIPDMPEASGMLNWTIPAWDEGGMFTDPEDIENEDIAQILMQLIAYRVEASHAQSARMVQGFIPVPEGQPSDVARMRQGLQRLRNLIEFVAQTQPSDRPESTPREMPVTAGRTGTSPTKK